MKKLLTGLALVALLAGCASREKNENGMGGTSDQTISERTIDDERSIDEDGQHQQDDFGQYEGSEQPRRK